MKSIFHSNGTIYTFLASSQCVFPLITSLPLNKLQPNRGDVHSAVVGHGWALWTHHALVPRAKARQFDSLHFPPLSSICIDSQQNYTHFLQKAGTKGRFTPPHPFVELISISTPPFPTPSPFHSVIGTKRRQKQAGSQHHKRKNGPMLCSFIKRAAAPHKCTQEALCRVTQERTSPEAVSHGEALCSFWDEGKNTDASSVQGQMGSVSSSFLVRVCLEKSSRVQEFKGTKTDAVCVCVCVCVCGVCGVCVWCVCVCECACVCRKRDDGDEHTSVRSDSRKSQPPSEHRRLVSTTFLWTPTPTSRCFVIGQRRENSALFHVGVGTTCAPNVVQFVACGAPLTSWRTWRERVVRPCCASSFQTSCSS